MKIRNLLSDVRSRKIAIIDGDDRITYAELSQSAAKISRALGESKSKRIMIFLPNGARYCAAFFGAVAAGKTAFPVNIGLTVFEAANLIKHSDADCVLTERQFEEFFAEVGGILGKSLEMMFAEDVLERPLIEACAPPTVPSSVPMVLLNTSGTTGNPKIVMLSEDNVGWTASAYLSKMNFSKFREKKYLLVTPFSTAYGIMILCACFYKRYPLVLPEGRDVLGGVLATCRKHRVPICEGGAAVLTMLDRMTGRKIPPVFRYPLYFGFGGSAVAGETLERLKRAFPEKEFWNGYGMTEASPLISKTYKRMEAGKLASVGTPLPGETVRIETDGKIHRKPFRRGEILVKGPNVMLGYYGNEAAAKECLRGGFLHTGDVGYFDGDGYLYLCGRMKNIVIVRGFNVYPEEVASVLTGCPLVGDCVVYGEREGTEDECVCADVVPASPAVSAEEIAAFCRSRLAPYKIPGRIRFTDHIHKTATDKSVRDR